MAEPSDAPGRDAAGVALNPFEQVAVKLGRLTNETPAGRFLQEKFLRGVCYPWVRASLARRTFADGLDAVVGLRPDRGVLFASNHRSFFDQHAVLLGIWMGPTPWARQLHFPVRSNFFYETPLGVITNFLIVGGAMYPPIFRQAQRTALNKDAIDRIIKFLAEPGAVIGVHPEGTRGKGPDPYEMLPAQPGIGQIALQARPIVIPAFVNGLTNDFMTDVRANFQPDIRRRRPVIVVYGEPLDYSDLLAQKPRPTLYLKAAERFRQTILKLSVKERELRASALAGGIPDDHPGWLSNRKAGRLYASPE